MEREFHDEWYALQQEALSALRACGSGERGYVVIARALVLASFDDSRAYALLKPRGRKEAPELVKRYVWRRTVDLGKFESPVVRLRYPRPLHPTVEADAERPLSSTGPLLARILDARVSPCVLDSPLGVDGVSYEVAFGDSSTRSTFRWWVTPPVGWEPFEQLVTDLETLFDGV